MLDLPEHERDIGILFSAFGAFLWLLFSLSWIVNEPLLRGARIAGDPPFFGGIIFALSASVGVRVVGAP